MRKLYWAVGALVLVVLGIGIVGITAVLADEEVSLEQVPAAVRAAIEKHAGQGEIVKIERETEDGRVVYEAEVIVNGKEVEFQVSATGEYLGAEAEDEDKDKDEDEDGDEDGDEDEDDDDEDDDHEGKGAEDEEESVAWNQLPPAVQDALRAALPNVKKAEYARETEDGFVVYEAEYKADGTEHAVKVTEDGQIIETEEQLAPSALPSAIVARLRKQFPDAEIKKAERVVVTFYEIELEAGGKEREIRMFANGQVLDDEDD